MTDSAENVSIDTEVELARLAAIVASSNDAIISKDINGIVTSWNAAAERIFGWSAAEMIGRPITTIIPAELVSEEAGIIAKIRCGEQVEHFDTVRLAKDGSRIDVSITVSPLHNGRGEIVGASKVARDITERKRSEELQQVLVNELNHRTKNLLATIQAIAVQTFWRGENIEDQLDMFRQRIRALSVSQDLLTNGGWSGTPLHAMVDAVLDPFMGEPQQIEIRPGPELSLSLRQTNSLAMAIHELATNAVKYGALSTPEGRVTLSWQTVDDDLALEWQERGGPDVSVPTRKGFGTHMIRNALHHELGASVDLDYARQGLKFRGRFALGARADAPGGGT